MKRRVMNHTPLLFLCIALRYTIAEKTHWNPSSLDQYHSFSFPERKENDVKSTIKWQGWTFAGRGEFPWLVEIRSNDTEDFDKQDDWANGNLVSSTFILTVCTAVVEFKKYDDEAPIKKDPLFSGVDVEMTYISVKNPKFYKVLYSDDYTYKTVGNGLYTGTRQVKRFIPHPKCNNFELDYQWGVVEVQRPIWPVPPWTSYMPIQFDKDAWAKVKEKYVNTKSEDGLEDAAPCTVGLWSRKLGAEYKDGSKTRVYNFTKVWNYKVKYAVVPVNPHDCWDPKGIDALPSRVRTGETIYEWECMGINTNETIGTVCDRDRGAPIVCDGFVRAIVLVGATPENCNINKPKPFLVMDLKYAMDLFAETNNDEWNLADLRTFLRISL